MIPQFNLLTNSIFKNLVNKYQSWILILIDFPILSLYCYKFQISIDFYTTINVLVSGIICHFRCQFDAKVLTYFDCI